MRQSPYVSMRESLIRRRILSPAARDMSFEDLIHQLEHAGPEWAVKDLTDAWNQAGASGAAG
jgi:hypothetical protein